MLPLVLARSAWPVVGWKAALGTSIGVAAGGSSFSRSRALSVVTATSPVVATAVLRQPPSGSIELRQGGTISIASSDVPGASATDRTWTPGDRNTPPLSAVGAAGNVKL